MKHKLKISTEERLEKLERNLTRAKRDNRRMIVVGVGIVLGALALLVVWGSPVSVAQAQENAADKKVIRAQEFVLVDEQDKPRAMLTISEDEPAMSLHDDRGEIRAMLGVTKDRSFLRLYDERGEPRAGMDVAEDGPRLKLFDEQGNGHTVLIVDKDGPSLIMYDEKGEGGAMLTVLKVGSRLVMFEQGEIIWRAP
jgi:hypothetical protein